MYGSKGVCIRKLEGGVELGLLSLCGAWWQIAGSVRGRYALQLLILNDGSSCFILNVL